MRRLTCIVLLVFASTVAVATSAYADGGPSIAAAPTVAVGQQEFGNLSTYIEPPNYPGNAISWWALPLTIGDSVAMQWEAQLAATYLRLYGPTVTDFNLYSLGTEGRLIDTNTSFDAEKSENTYKATGSGDYHFYFEHPVHSGEARSYGSYSFTVHITHALSLGLSHVGALRHRGRLTVAVHNPEGGPINDPTVQVELQIKGRGSWQRLGTGTASNSAAVIAFSVPARLRHQHVTLRALARATGYSPASSLNLRARTL